MSDDEFDNIPDDFANVPDVDWAQLLAGPSSASNGQGGIIAGPPHRNREDLPISPQSNDSSLYFPDDEMDSSFLAELDQVEQRITGGPRAPPSGILDEGMPQVRTASRNGGTSPTSVQMPGATVAPQPQSHGVSEPRSSHYFQNRATTRFSSQNSKNNEPYSGKQTSTIPIKRVHSAESSDIISPKRKGKIKAINELQQILSGYEDELTCPICCDLFVASHVGNPCGHTFCGDCGWQWHVQNRKKACPFCRMNLDENVPVIPNIAMDNTVAKHVKALAQSGIREWEPGGAKFQEWDARKQAWRKGAGKREQKKNARRPAKPPLIEVFDVPINWFQMGDNEEEDPDYVDSDIELIPRPIQRARRRR